MKMALMILGGAAGMIVAAELMAMFIPAFIVIILLCVAMVLAPKI